MVLGEALLRTVLNFMTTLSNNDIAQAIYLTSKDKTGHELALSLKNVVSFLHRRRLLNKSEEILFSLNKIINDEKGVKIAKVSSANKLHEQNKKEIIHLFKKRYLAKDVIIEEKIEENLLGGVKIEINNELIDLTLKNRIYKLQEYLTTKYE